MEGWVGGGSLAPSEEVMRCSIATAEGYHAEEVRTGWLRADRADQGALRSPGVGVTVAYSCHIPQPSLGLTRASTEKAWKAADIQFLPPFLLRRMSLLPC